jgi:hypothetical protein
MRLMVAVLLTGVIALIAALAIAVLRSGWTPSRRQIVSREQRSSGGADPYAAQRKPEKLNPGLGGCASGGGGG